MSRKAVCERCLCVFLRFKYDGRWREKLQTLVDFPLDNLDLSQYVIGPKHTLKKYNLYAVSVSMRLHTRTHTHRHA